MSDAEVVVTPVIVRSPAATAQEAGDERMTAGRRLRILHLILMVGETNGQYNEHCLPLVEERDLAICTYFRPRLIPPPEIAMFPGDGTLRGFFRALRTAVDSREYDIIHAHAPQSGVLLVAALLGWRRFRALRSSLVYTVQDSFHDYRLRDRAMMVLAIPAFARIVFCSRAAYDSLPRPLRALVGRRWRVVQNGADLDRLDAAIRSPSVTRDADRFTVVSVGRLESVKDPMTLLEAFALDDDTRDRLTVVGTGQLEGAAAARAAALGIDDRVTFTGLLPRDDVFGRCAAGDVFVSTSHGEGLPVAVIEAMAAGCPVILSDIPPHREVADGADFIPFVPRGHVKGFTREIARFREMPSEDREAIGRRCSEHVRARFSLGIMHSVLGGVYEELIGEPEGPGGRP